MKFLALAALAGAAVAYPGQKDGKKGHAGVFKRIIERAGERLLQERQQPPAQPVILIGDLQTAGTGGTPTNERIMGCFNSPNGATCTSTEQYTPPTRDTPQCEADTCCIWAYIRDDLIPLMRNPDGTCNDFARNAVRFGFHDAGAWDTDQTRGGADGSLLLEPGEVARPANFGLEVSKNILGPIFQQYQSYGISAADLVQFAHNVAVVVCPLGPRSLTYVGRPDWQAGDLPNPDGLLPDATSSADVLLDLFADKTIGTVDLVALLGAHTTAKQFFFDPSAAGMPLDTTPGVWDVAFYAEVLNGTTPCGVFRLPSDDNMGNDVGRARNGFTAMSAGFPADTSAGQILWNGLYSKAYLRLSLLGVANIQGLTDCTKVLPNEIPTFVKPPSAIVSCPASSSSSSVLSSATSSTVSSATSDVSSVSSTLSTVTSATVSSSSVVDPSSSSSVISSSIVDPSSSSSGVSSSAAGPSSSSPGVSSSVIIDPSSSTSSAASVSATTSSAPIFTATVSTSGVSSELVNPSSSSSRVIVDPSSSSSRVIVDPSASSRASVASSTASFSNGGSRDPSTSSVRTSASSRSSGVGDPSLSSRSSVDAASSRSYGGSGSQQSRSSSASRLASGSSQDPRPTSSRPGYGGPGGPGNGGNDPRPSSSRGNGGYPGGPGGNDPRPSSTRGNSGYPGSPSGNDPRPTSSRGNNGPGNGGYPGGGNGGNDPRPTTSSRLAQGGPGNGGYPGGGNGGSDPRPSSRTTTVEVTRTSTITLQYGRKTTSTWVESVATVVPVDPQPAVRTTTYSVTRTTTIVGQYGRKTTSTWVEPVTTVVPVDPQWSSSTTTVSITRTSTIIGQYGRKTTSIWVEPVTTMVVYPVDPMVTPPAEADHCAVSKVFVTTTVYA